MNNEPAFLTDQHADEFEGSFTTPALRTTPREPFHSGLCNPGIWQFTLMEYPANAINGAEAIAIRPDIPGETGFPSAAAELIGGPKARTVALWRGTGTGAPFAVTLPMVGSIEVSRITGTFTVNAHAAFPTGISFDFQSPIRVDGAETYTIRGVRIRPT